MRRRIEVRGDPQLKRAQLQHSWGGVQEGQPVRIKQGDATVYATYHQSQRMDQKQATINPHFLLLNGLQQGRNCEVEGCQLVRAGHITAQVSELDWRIISRQQELIAESFLEQCRAVWPGAKIPIYYDDHNYVVLLIQCTQPSQLDVNTMVEFIEEVVAKDGEEEQEQEQEEEEEEQVSQNLVMSGSERELDEEGYLNVITVHKELLNRLQIQENSVWKVTNSTDFCHCPTLKQLLDYDKRTQQQQQQKDKEIGPSRTRLVFIRSSSDLKSQHYECSKACKQLLQLSDQIIISNQPSSRQEISSMALDVLLKDQKMSLTLAVLPQEDSPKLTALQLGKIMAETIIESASQLEGFIVLQEAYPLLIGGQLCTLKLTHKQQPRIGQQFKRINTLTAISQEQRPEYISNISKKITVNIMGKGKDSSSKSSMTLAERYNSIETWLKVQKKLKSHEPEQNHSTIDKIFKSIYSSEIQKIADFINDNSQDRAQKICMVTSYGNNGKTYLHTFLSQQGINAWLVNLQPLNQPQIRFQDIDFYLHWIMANSPYPTIYLDNLDALTPNIQDSDQHRKKEKVVSKLIIKKITEYRELYGLKLIVTAKSEGNVDTSLSGHFCVNLKNPPRQDRLKALKLVEELKKQQGQQIQDGLTEKVTDATQSLTFGAFSQHASQLSVPQQPSLAQKFDYSKLAGLAQAKTTIRGIIEKPIKYSFLFKSVPIKLPRGVLLYGATGNGKSALGTAVADEFKMKYFSVKGSDILSKYIGGSEAAVRDVFERALSVSPSIIFFDEFESIVPRRSSNNTGVNDRIVNQFLCYLDGVSATAGVYIVAASSRPDLIDPAILRPGRLDAHLFLDYPKEEERLELIRMFGQSVRIDVPEERIVDVTKNYSYCDLIGLMKQLRIKRSAQVIKMENYKPQDFMNIDSQLFDSTINGFKLSVAPQEQLKQRKIYQAFKQGGAPDVSKQKQVQL